VTISKPHWLAPSATTRTPKMVITFDTETTEVEEEDHSTQRLRCWDALVRNRAATTRNRKVTTYHQGETAASLGDVVEQATDVHPEVWVIAHNVGFDLTVTSLPFLLVHRGWQLDGVHLGDESSWWVLKRDQRKIVITDSWSWVRCSLADAAKDMGKRKVPLPKDDDELAQWHKRCRRDVEILDSIMATIMDWWDEHELGIFGITGAACGWRTLRKQVPPRRILVGPDPDRTDFERGAIFGGSKDVYGVGEFHEPWIADYDFKSAYTTAAAGFPTPTMPAKKWTTNDQLLTTEVPAQRDYIARVRITTYRPCAPCRIGDEIYRPVGTFVTTLAGPEVRYALTRAESVTVLDWRAYKVGYALADWAAWCLTIQSAPASEVPPIVARVAKNWGRLAIGRFASRTSRVVATRPSMHLGWHLETGHDLDTGARCEWLSMGGVEQTILKDQDGSDAFPAVLAFIEGHVRVALHQMIDSRPPANVLQINTDGWWEMRAPRTSDYLPPSIPWPFRVTRKALERRLTVKGPNHVLTPHERRYAGVPGRASVSEDEVMHWRDWPGLRWQLEHSVTGEYKRPDREAILAEHYVRRWVLATGETIPVTTQVDPEGTTVLQPWSLSWGRRAGDILAYYQVPTLASVLESDADPATMVNVPLPDQPGRGFTYRPGPTRRPKRPSRQSLLLPPAPAMEPLVHFPGR